MARTATRRRQGTFQGRKRVWARNNNIATPNAIGVAQDLAEDFILEMGTNHLPVGSTINGILLDLHVVQLDARTSSTDAMQIGIICTDEETAAEVPRPGPDPHADWMWYQLIGSPGSGAGSTFSTAAALGGPIRIRAKRRCEELGSHLWIVFGQIGLTTYDVRYSASTLMLLP